MLFLYSYAVAELHRLHHRTGDTGYTAEMVERIKYYLCID
jgi:type VI protein secretion system component VasF